MSEWNVTMQASFSELEYAGKKKVTRRDRFLSEIETITPWAALVAEVEPFYPKGEGRGRPPIGLERMLRMYVAQGGVGQANVASAGDGNFHVYNRQRRTPER
jgi:hypothetical protein